MSEMCDWCEYDEAHETDSSEVTNEFEKKIDKALESSGIDIAVERGHYDEYTCTKCGAVFESGSVVLTFNRFTTKGKVEMRV